jgi:hypothetical protein
VKADLRLMFLFRIYNQIQFLLRNCTKYGFIDNNNSVKQSEIYLKYQPESVPHKAANVLCNAQFLTRVNHEIKF